MKKIKIWHAPCGKYHARDECPDRICELCGKMDELRPYGAHGERICYACGLKDEETTKRWMGAVLFGDAGCLDGRS